MAFVNMNREKEIDTTKENHEKTFRMNPSITSCRVLCGRDNPCGNSHCSNYRGFKKHRTEKQ